MNISDLMANISMIENTSEKIEKLNIYAEELNAEMLKIKELKCDSPLCILVLTEGITCFNLFYAYYFYLILLIYVICL